MLYNAHYNGAWFYINVSWGRILFQNMYSHMDGVWVFSPWSEWHSQKRSLDHHPSKFLVSNKAVRRENFIKFSRNFWNRPRRAQLFFIFPSPSDFTFINWGCSYLGELFGLSALLRGEKAGEQPGWAVCKGDESCNGAAVWWGWWVWTRAAAFRHPVPGRTFTSRRDFRTELWEMQMELLYLN